MIDRRAPPAAALIVALTCIAALAAPARSQDRAGSEAALEDDEAGPALAAPTSSAAAHQAALCMRLGALLRQSLPTPERAKAAETRKALHCAEPLAVSPVAGSSHALDAVRPAGR